MEARDTASIGGVSDKGTPPTPIPISAWIGIDEFSEQALVNVMARDRFQGNDLVVTMLMAGPKMVTPAFYAISNCLCGKSPARRTLS